MANGMVVHVDLIGLTRYNTCVRTFEWLSSGWQVKFNYYKWLLKHESKDSHFSIGLCIEIELTLQPCMLGVIYL
jgi:hypothetical protein